jgi:hypothetical protein
VADADVQRLEKMDEPKLLDYVRDRLLGLPSVPSVDWSHGGTPEQLLIDAAALSSDDRFKARLRLCVKRLLEAWRPGLDEKADYGGRLIYLTGRLGAEGGAEILAELAFRPAVDALVGDGERLSNLALRTLLDFPGQAARAALWEPLADDPRFFDTAFFAFTLCGAREGLQNLGRYLEMARAHGLPDTVVDFRLTHFIRRHILGRPRHVDALGAALRSLPTEGRRVAEEIVRRRFPDILEALTAQPPSLRRSVAGYYESAGLDTDVEVGRLGRASDLFVGNHAG